MDLDCVVTHPAAPSNLPGTTHTAGFAAAQEEQLKHTDSEQFGQGVGYEFVPLAMEFFGRLGCDASRFLSELGNIAASDGHVRKGAFVQSMRQELSFALCCGNARIYFQSTVFIAQALGRQFMPVASACTTRVVRCSQCYFFGFSGTGHWPPGWPAGRP